jgi:hypothetical protein
LQLAARTALVALARRKLDERTELIQPKTLVISGGL